MEKLVTGVHQFQQGYFSKHQELYERLAHEQRPELLFITCSDSRINPNLVTQTQPGEMFVIRNAGNMMPSYEQAKLGYSGEAATLQYAVEVLNVHDIIVCGHTDCGAVKAMMNPPEKLAELDLVAQWLSQEAQLRKVVHTSYADRDPARQHVAAIEENVLFQLEDLRSYPFVQKRLEAGTLHLHGWVYHIAKGQIFSYNPADEQFQPIAQAYQNGTEPLATAQR